MNDLIALDFEGSTVRVVEIDGAPWFVGRDVAERLGYADPTNAMKQHCKGVVKRHPLQTSGGIQEVRVLYEPDVLRLIVSSKLPAAERFERWVFEEVLPSICRTGRYGPTPDLSDPVVLQHLLLEQVAGRIAAEARVTRAEQELARERLGPRRLEPNPSRLARAGGYIMNFLGQATRPVARSELYRRVDGHLDARQLDTVMRDLVDSGRVEVVVERTPGRSRTTYRTLPAPE